MISFYTYTRKNVFLIWQIFLPIKIVSYVNYPSLCYFFETLKLHYQPWYFLVFLLISHSHFSHFIFSYLSFSFEIVMSSLWLISLSISAWDTKVLMLLSLLLSNIRILSCFCFLLFLIIYLLFLLLKKMQ